MPLATILAAVNICLAIAFLQWGVFPGMDEAHQHMVVAFAFMTLLPLYFQMLNPESVRKDNQ